MNKENKKKDEKKLYAEINIRVPLNEKVIGACNPVEVKQGMENMLRIAGINGFQLLQYVSKKSKTEIKTMFPKL